MGAREIAERYLKRHNGPVSDEAIERVMEEARLAVPPFVKQAGLAQGLPRPLQRRGKAKKTGEGK